MIKDRVEEILVSIFSLNLKPDVWAATLFGGFTIGALSGTVENFVITPAVSYYALIAIMLWDHFMGVRIALKKGTFETEKFLNIIWKMLSHTGLLVATSALSKGSVSLFWLNEAVFVPIVLANLLSVVKNLSILGHVKKEIAEFFYKKVDVFKNNKTEKDE